MNCIVCMVESPFVFVTFPVDFHVLLFPILLMLNRPLSKYLRLNRLDWGYITTDIREEFTSMPTRLALAGATGYIGHNLLNELKKKYDVIALSRNGDDKDNEERVEWRSCDLFSLDDTIEGMK